MSVATKPFRFGVFELDPSSGELRKNGTRIALSEQPFKILTRLLQHPGELVSREELRRELWASDTFVDFEHGLNAAVKRLRDALGDSAETPRFIETIPRRGYRFIFPMDEFTTGVAVQPEFAPAAATGTRHRRLLIILAVSTLALLSMVALRFYFRPSRAATTQGHTIAVLPFTDMSPTKDQEYFSDGLSEELITNLSRTPGLRVSARTSSFQFKGGAQDVRVIGRKLNVETILEGGVRKEGSRVRITVQLINTADGFHIWSEVYDRELKDIFAVQEEIGTAVAEALKLSLLRPPAVAGGPPQQKNMDAYKAFLQARYFSDRRSAADMQKAISYYETALKLNPEDARSWAGLAEARTHQADNGFVEVEPAYGKARFEVEQALRLSPDLAKAHQVMGWIKMAHDWDFAGAEASFKRALLLDPGDAMTVWETAALMADLGRAREALELNLKSADMDPLSPRVFMNLGDLQFMMGDLEAAEASLLKGLELDPVFPAMHEYLCRVYLFQNRPELALQAAQQETQAEWKLVALSLTYWKLGRIEEADKTLQELITKFGWGFAFQVAEIYAYRGDKEKAFEWLERAYALRDPGVSGMKLDPLLRTLTDDHRYSAFLKKAGLPL